MILRVWGRERKLQEMQYRAETLFFVSHHPSSTVIFFAQHQFNHLNFDSFLTQWWLIIDSILNLCPLNLFVCKYIFSGEKQNQLLILGHQRVFWRQNHQGLLLIYYFLLFDPFDLSWKRMLSFCVSIVEKLFKIFPLLAMTSWHLSILLQVNITNKFHKPISQKELLGCSCLRSPHNKLKCKGK